MFDAVLKSVVVAVAVSGALFFVYFVYNYVYSNKKYILELQRIAESYFQHTGSTIPLFFASLKFRSTKHLFKNIFST